MRIAKPLLLTMTPIGVVGGLHEAFRLAGGLAFIMIALLLVVGTAIAMLVLTIIKEQRADPAGEARQLQTSHSREINP